jgi:hypothetical protein
VAVTRRCLTTVRLTPVVSEGNETGVLQRRGLPQGTGHPEAAQPWRPEARHHHHWREFVRLLDALGPGLGHGGRTAERRTEQAEAYRRRAFIFPNEYADPVPRGRWHGFRLTEWAGAFPRWVLRLSQSLKSRNPFQNPLERGPSRGLSPHPCCLFCQILV